MSFVIFKKHEVRSRKGELLGLMTFNGGWSKHVFEPFENTFYDTLCMKEIAVELRRRDKEWKQKNK